MIIKDDKNIICFLILLLFPGQRQVVGPAQPIIAALGDDVILPCHLKPIADVQDKTVVWSKPDLKPDPLNPQRGVDYVHLYRNRMELPDMQIPSYNGRTALFVNELKHGNISLKITNVTLEDHGRYRCFIPKLNGRVKPLLLICASQCDETCQLINSRTLCFPNFCKSNIRACVSTFVEFDPMKPQ
uniref:Ig-like domain-containing protein n=1 Tax=Amphiprion ocellaris TaxID=80972 RepID=A0A3Q1BP60_AMPOC